MFRFSVLSGLLLCVGLVGCSSGDRPPLGRVSGTVTMDGKPLAGVIVSFQPETGRAASAETDAEGNFDLEYTYQVKGAKIGPNTVSFAWPTGAEGKQNIPARFSTKSELKEEVKSGKNTFKFELTSK
ncbi:MAG: carboxypeptidase-like regulatory domain-containing protein [Pirellulaceae bacterium]|nr:carboxypeptidase-like regulatory domain-containing protein [Pirellulaceae bacterium]